MKHIRSQRGFTLLEMLVSLGIFTVVAVIAVGALVRIVGLNKQAQTLQASMNNLSFALEAWSREMRVGTNYSCSADPASWSYTPGDDLPGTDCQLGSGNVVAFVSAKTSTNSGGETCRLVHAYRLWVGQLQKAQQVYCSDVLTSDSFSSIIDDANITLTSFRFGVYTQEDKHAWAFIRLAGYAGLREQDKNFFDVQTSISQRIKD